MEKPRSKPQIAEIYEKFPHERLNAKFFSNMWKKVLDKGRGV